MYYHKVHKDNHEFKLVTQGKEVVNKVTVQRLRFDYGMIP
jgi:hypothetical protein